MTALAARIFWICRGLSGVVGASLVDPCIAVAFDVAAVAVGIDETERMRGDARRDVAIEGGSLLLAATPSDSGWVVVTTGPRLSGGWVLEEQWALTVEGRAQATWMDPQRTFQPEILPWLVVMLGVESSV